MARISSSGIEGKLISEERITQRDSSVFPLSNTFLVVDNVNMNDWYFKILKSMKTDFKFLKST